MEDSVQGFVVKGDFLNTHTYCTHKHTQSKREQRQTDGY